MACGPFRQFAPMTAASASRSWRNASRSGVPSGSRPSSVQAMEQMAGQWWRACFTSSASRSSGRSVNVSKKMASTPPSSSAPICSWNTAFRSMPCAFACSALSPSGPTLPATAASFPRAASLASFAAVQLISFTRFSKPYFASRAAFAPKLFVSMSRAPAPR